MSEYPDGWDHDFHPRWCDPKACSAPPARDSLAPAGGAHRSVVVRLNLEATARGETGQVTGQLQQSLRAGAKPFLVWLIGGVHVGHIPLEDAGPIALLIADGLGHLEDLGQLEDPAHLGND